MENPYVVIYYSYIFDRAGLYNGRCKKPQSSAFKLSTFQHLQRPFNDIPLTRVTSFLHNQSETFQQTNNSFTPLSIANFSQVNAITTLICSDTSKRMQEHLRFLILCEGTGDWFCASNHSKESNDCFMFQLHNNSLRYWNMPSIKEPTNFPLEIMSPLII